MHLPISNTYTHTHTQRSCLQTSNPARFTFAGLGGWCQGVTSAECDLPCREHYYPREEFNTGGQPGAIFNSLLGNAEKGWSEHLKKEKVALTKKKKKTALAFREPVSCEHAAVLTSPHLSHLIFSAPVQGRFSTGLQRAPTQRAGQPAVITPCKCHLGLLMRPVSYQLNWFGGYHPARTHICGAQRMGVGGGGVICSFIHLEILLLLLF